MSSAAAWVARSRALRVPDEKEEVKQTGKSSSEYSSSDLEGLAIRHASSELESGKEIILTLADRSVLDSGEVAGGRRAHSGECKSRGACRGQAEAEEAGSAR